MNEQAALPPAPAPAPGNGFDMDAFAHELNQPKQPGGAPPPPPKVEPATPPGATGGAETPKSDASSSTDAPKTTEEAPNTKDKYNDAAREYMETYDLLQSQGFSALAQKEAPVEKFLLEKFAKQRAIHHLARGLRTMEVGEMPWWIGLSIALTPPAIGNYMLAMELRKQREARKVRETRTARENEERKARGEPLQPTSIINADGSVVTPAPPPAAAPAPVAAQAPPASTSTPTTITAKARIVYGTCPVDGNPLYKKRAKYCSQSCAGKATSKLMREKRTKP